MRTKGYVIAAVAVLTVVLSGCGWRQVGYGPERSGFNNNESTIGVGNVASLTQAWSATVPNDPNPPAMQGNNLHVTAGNSYTTINASDGSIHWQETFTNNGLDSFLYAPSVTADGRARVPANGYRSGATLLFDPATKTYSGSFSPFGSAAPATAEAVRNDVTAGVVGTIIPTDVLWELVYGPHRGFIDFAALGTPIPTDPAIVGSHVVLGYGTYVLSYPVGSCLPVPPPIPFGCGWEYRVNLASDVSMPVGVSAALVAVGTAGGDLKVLNASDGSTVATADLGSTRVHAPAVANGVIYAVNEAGVLSAVPASGCTTCSPTWTANLGGAGYSQPIVANGVVYVGAADGKVHAFDASGCGNATCNELWSATVDASGDVLYPVVNNGRLYVTADTGTVKAFKLP